MFLSVPFYPSCKDFSIKSLFTCGRGKRWTTSKISSQFILSIVQKAFLRILSMKKKAFCLYSVWNWRIPAYTQYTVVHEDECVSGTFVLYWVYEESLLFYTENTQEATFFILNIRRKPPFSYWVFAESLLFHTECTQKGSMHETKYSLDHSSRITMTD